MWLYYKGRVLFNGQNILDPNINVVELRRKIGIVFSRPVPLPLTIYQNISYGLEVAGERRKSRLDQAVERALRQAVLWDEVYDRLNDPAHLAFRRAAAAPVPGARAGPGAGSDHAG